MIRVHLVKRPSGVWQLRWRDRATGRHHAQSTGQRTKQAAEAAQHQKWLELAGLAPPALNRVRFQDHVETELRVLAATRSKATAESTRVALKSFEALTGVGYLDQITASAIEQWIEHRQTVVAVATVNRDLRTLAASLQRALRRGHLRENVARRIPLLREPERVVRVLTQDEERRLLLACADGLLNTLVRVALDSGMRLGELLHCRWADVDLGNRLIYVRAEDPANGWRTKTGRARQVAFGSACKPGLLELSWRGWEYVFWNPKRSRADSWGRRLQEAFAEACEDAHVENLSLHDLRRTCATRLASVLMPAEHAAYLGHCIAVTMRYYVCQQALDAARKARAALDECARLVRTQEAEADGADHQAPQPPEAQDLTE